LRAQRGNPRVLSNNMLRVIAIAPNVIASPDSIGTKQYVHLVVLSAAKNLVSPIYNRFPGPRTGHPLSLRAQRGNPSVPRNNVLRIIEIAAPLTCLVKSTPYRRKPVTRW